MSADRYRRQSGREPNQFLVDWLTNANRIGSAPEELFGLQPDAAMVRYDQMGLIWVLKGERSHRGEALRLADVTTGRIVCDQVKFKCAGA